MSSRARVLAAGGVAGPVAFVASWAVLGEMTPGYSPVGDAISRLAASGAPYRPWMTAGMVAFGFGVGAHAISLPSAGHPIPGALLGAGALATLAVAALPLGSSALVDAAHAVAATATYASLSAAAVGAGLSWRASSRRWSRWSLVAGTVSGALLAASAAGPGTGFLQRAGLTIVDAWIVATALAAWRGTLPPGVRHSER